MPAITPIATEKQWNNTDCIHSYKADEFTRRITNAHNKNSLVYDIIKEFKGGNNIKKGAKTELSAAELLVDPNKYKKIGKLYDELRAAPGCSPPSRLSLPYPTTEERKNALIERLATIYDDLDMKARSYYKVFHGYYNDGKVEYPYAFEILAIPRTRPNLKETEFIGAVNYSVSPRSIRFEGEYNVQGRPRSFFLRMVMFSFLNPFNCKLSVIRYSLLLT